MSIESLPRPLVGLLLLMTCGCGEPAAPPPVVASVASPGETATLQPDAEPLTESAPSDESEPRDPGTPVDAAFDPPFGNRTDLFAPPTRRRTLVAQTGEETEESVELKGFVDVGGPRVVLAINGVTSPVAEGESRLGVEVISIQPPNVVLQRGRDRWTAKLDH